MSLPNPDQGGNGRPNPPPRTKADIESAAERPRALSVNPDGIPFELKERRQWVGWQYNRPGDRWTELPINPKDGRPASSTDPATWSAFDEALAYYERHKADGGADGIGYVFTADDLFVGVDLDDCFNLGTKSVEPWAAEIVAELASYAELSPSRTGVKLFLRGKVPPGGNRKSNVEMCDNGGFFAVTGRKLLSAPPTVNDGHQALDRLHARLWAGDTTGNTSTGEAEPLLAAALRYLEAGLSVIPIKRNGSKAPQLIIWGPYKERPPTEDEVRAWFSGERPPGVGIVGGTVSGNLLVLDFEFLDFFEEWCALVETARPGLVARLPAVETPRKCETMRGRHVYARSSGPSVPSNKLARITKAEAQRRTGDHGRTTAVEVKAEKGYVLAPGCPPDCHETGRLYEHVAGPPIEETPTLTEEEVEFLLAYARALERGDKASADREPAPAGGDDNRPGDDFNRRARWADVLPDGWKKVREDGEVIYLCRPCKDQGVSATIGYCRSDRAGPKLYVFSTNAEPFEAGRSYSKFEATPCSTTAATSRPRPGTWRARGTGRPAPGARRGTPPRKPWPPTRS
jgi:hypothetical protein